MQRLGGAVVTAGLSDFLQMAVDHNASERRISVFDKANASHYAPGHRCLTSSLASAFIEDVALC
jgi:hypothetical protein